MYTFLAFYISKFYNINICNTNLVMNTDELLTLQMHNRAWAMGYSYRHTMPAKDARMPILWVWTTRSRSFWASGMYISHLETNFRCSYLCFVTIMCMWYRMFVGIEQNIVKLAGSTSDYVNGLDMNSSSIQAQMLVQDFQGNLLLVCHFIQSSRKMAARLFLL